MNDAPLAGISKVDLALSKIRNSIANKQRQLDRQRDLDRIQFDNYQELSSDLPEILGHLNSIDDGLHNASLTQIVLSQTLTTAQANPTQYQTGTMSGLNQSLESDYLTINQDSNGFTAVDPSLANIAYIVINLSVKVGNPHTGAFSALIKNPIITWTINGVPYVYNSPNSFTENAFGIISSGPIYTDPGNNPWSPDSISLLRNVGIKATFKSNPEDDPWGPYIGSLDINSSACTIDVYSVSTRAMWLTQAEIMALPTSGSAAWTNISNKANGSWGTPDLSNQTKVHTTYCLAGALVAVRTNSTVLKDKVRDNIILAKRTMDDDVDYNRNSSPQVTRTLGVGRQIAGLCIAADIIDLPNYDPVADAEFRSWLNTIKDTILPNSNPSYGKTLVRTHECTAGWGFEVGGSRTAIEIYLGNVDGLERCYNIFKSYIMHGFYPDGISPTGVPPYQTYFITPGHYEHTWICGDDGVNINPNWLPISPTCNKTYVKTVNPTTSTIGSNVLTTTSTFYTNETSGNFTQKFGVQIGDAVTDVRFPVGTVVQFIDSPTSIRLSQNAIDDVAGSTSFSSGPHNIDGAITTETSRQVSGGDTTPFTWPPHPEGYSYHWTALVGIVLQAELLYRAGYTDAYTLGNSFVKRTLDFIVRAGWHMPFTQHAWIPWIVNKRYGTTFPTMALNVMDWGMGWTDWTHAINAEATSTSEGDVEQPIEP